MISMAEAVHQPRDLCFPNVRLKSKEEIRSFKLTSSLGWTTVKQVTVYFVVAHVQAREIYQVDTT